MNRAQSNPKPAFLFDLDGTLVDTAPDIVATTNCMLADLGAAALPFDTVKGFIGRGVPYLVHCTLDAAKPGSAADEERARQLFHRHYDALNGRLSTVFPGVREGLAALHAQGCRLACVTNKPVVLARRLLAMTGLDAYLEFAVGGDSLPQMKPAPEPLLHASRGLDADPARCWMVGDSAVDVAAARAAGMPVCIVRYGYCGPDGAQALAGDRLIDSLLELSAFSPTHPTEAERELAP